MAGSVAYVAIGSNVEPMRNVPAAVEALSRRARLTGLSTFYQTQAIGRPEQDDFVNGVARLETGMAPLEFKHEVLRDIEKTLGRQRDADRYAPRTMDLDILLHGHVVLREAGLALPDPDILERPFLIAGLLELDPLLRMPDSGVLLRDLTGKPAGLTPLPELTEQLRRRFVPGAGR
ncbi:MAG: hypothetical protein RLZZ303_1774 [Candidatus Hydrogenedentota bacterium]|jgi:2-amino-4-hydroxy-6-hydroxymethyldihydropteridine diphosphokinase